MEIERRIDEAGLVLPQPIRLPPGVEFKFRWVRLAGDRALVSGHGPLALDGSLLKPLGKVGSEVSENQAYEAARATGLAILASLKMALGDLDRIACWMRAFGMVNTAPGFSRFPRVIDGFTDLVIDLFGPERGTHARSAIGVAGLPFNMPVEIEAELLLY